MDAVCLEMVTGGRKVPRERVEVVGQLWSGNSASRTWRSISYNPYSDEFAPLSSEECAEHWSECAKSLVS